MKDKLNILFVSSEVAPFTKTGGLADVAGSLPEALSELGHDVRIAMPEYDKIPAKYVLSLENLLHFRTKVSWRDEYVGVNRLKYNGLMVYFIDNKNYFHRDTLYENSDRHIQFAFFCRAVLEMLPLVDFKPDIIHFHDWQTGPLALMLEDNYQEYEFYQGIKTVYTIHNLRFQGQFGMEIINDVLGLDWRYWNEGIIRHNGLVNYMKMGIMGADAVTTVSKTYADEIKDPFYGEGLDYAIRMRSDDLYGIINGISYNEFDPANDRRIYTNYNYIEPEKKYDNKLVLQEKMGLPQEEKVPVLAMISRLTEQKGLDLLIHIFHELMKEDLQLIILGTGVEYYEKSLKNLEKCYPGKAAVKIKYDGELAQKIYAGSDIFLMPSKFEPCGLSQLISLRYGTIPVVRETGGLKDTIIPYNEETDKGYGFTFSEFNAHEFLYAIKRALSCYSRPDLWQKLVKRGMMKNFSWERSAEEYIDLYYRLKEDKNNIDKEDRIEVSKEIKNEKNNRVNINKASSSELTGLAGIGQYLANKIIKYREQAGKFDSLDQLREVKGISHRKLAIFKDDITL